MANFFPKIKAARQLLAERMEELLNLQIDLIKDAAAKGDFESATKANQWLIEHAPAEDGVRVIDASAAKPKEALGPAGPTIQIALALGGMPKPKELPPVSVIDIKPNG